MDELSTLGRHSSGPLLSRLAAPSFFSCGRDDLSLVLPTMSAPVTDREVIQSLGGPKAFAGLGCNEEMVKKWMQRGIPWKDRARVADFASRKRVKLPADFHGQRRVEKRVRRKAA